MKYPGDGGGRACCCKREVRAQLAACWSREKSEFSSHLCARGTPAVSEGEEADTCTMKV